MKFNVDKCKVLHIGQRNMEREYFMNGTKISTTTEEKDVGVYVCDNLKPGKQCSEAVKRASNILTQISKYFRIFHVFGQIPLYL